MLDNVNSQPSDSKWIVDDSIPRQVGDYQIVQLANGNAAAARSALSSCVTMVVVMGGIGLVGLTVATDFVPSVPKWRGVRDFTLLIASWGGLSAVCLLAASSLQALDDFRSAALVGARKGGVLANGLFFVLLLVAHRLGHLELGAAIGLQVVLNLIALALGILLVRKRLEERQWPARSPDDDGPGVQSARSRHDVGWFFRESWPNFVVQMASITTLELQIILLGFFTSERAHADYSAVLYLVGLVNAFHALATSAIAPFVAELHTAGNVDKLERLLRGSATLVAIPTLAASLLFILFPEYLLTTAFTPDFANGAWALRIISIGGVIAVLSGSNGLVLVMSGQQRLLMRYSLAASITFVVAVIPATRHFGINGAATAVSVVFGVYNVWITLLVKSRIGVWTIPTFSPKSLWTTLRALRGS